jgi:hypothetical protein
MHRREFIAYGSGAALAATLLKSQIEQEADAQSTSVNAAFFELHMEEIYEEMIDGEVLFALAFRDPVTRVLRPQLRFHQAAAGAVTIKLVNKTRRPRRFAITGLAAGLFPMIAPGGTATISLPTISAGSYIYHDNAEGASGRVLGLHGAMVITNRNCHTPAGNPTPYYKTRVTPELASLFDAFGEHYEFPGKKWDPSRDITWVMSQVDPAINRAAEAGIAIDLSLPVYRFRPRYFTLNGLSGYDAAHDEATVPKGYIGEPMLIRTMNAGIAVHAPHIHGNHVFRISECDSSNRLSVCDNLQELDTWCLHPLERLDVMLPFKKPDEIPPAAWPPREEPFPLLYPMHCHCEMSQTAGGGNYPQGLVTHWELLGTERVVA